MYEEVSNYDQPIEFIIGFAGSGKSTKLAELCKEQQTLVLTPTHRAASVLQDKGLKNVYTIHSVLKLVPTIDQNFRRGQRMQKLRQIGTTDLSEIKAIAVDEFSMISTEILDKLLAVLPSDCNVFVFGDASQLPPVDGTPIDPEMYTSRITKLTVQHRADNPEIVETFMRFHKYVETGTGKDLTVKLPKGDLSTFNPKTDTILAFTNNRVIELNTQVANMLGYPAYISNNEDILANGIDAVFLENTRASKTIYPTCISKGALMDEDKLDLAIVKTERDIEKFNTKINYAMCTINIEGNSYNCYYDVDHYNTQKYLKSKVEEAQHFIVDHHNLGSDISLVEWCKMNPNSEGVRARSKAWSDYLTHQNLVFDIRRPFCTTVHKAQGKEFSTVFIDQDNIKLSIKNNYYITYARLMYVALSRAINNVIIL